MPSSSTDAQLATQYSEAAIEVTNFLAGQRQRSESGITWFLALGDEAGGGRTLYHGSGGIALFLVEAFRATGNEEFLDLAGEAGDEIARYLSGRTGLSVAPATGWPGYAFVMAELADAAGTVTETGAADGERRDNAVWIARSERFRATARYSLDQLRAQASELGSGIGWIEPMPFSDITGFTGDREIYDQSVGAAGAGSFLLWAHRRGVHAEALTWAVAVADRLLEVAERDETGLRWRLMSDMPFPFTAPNFAHGGAGVGFFLADLYRETGVQRYLDAAIDAARYVQARALPVGDGMLVCHTEEVNPPMHYLGMCHGPVGTGRLFVLLTAITGDPQWAETAHSLIRGLLATGAPETRSDGLWNNVGQCCGDAGIGDYATWMSKFTGDPMYLELANRCAASLLSRSIAPEEGMRAWEQAEHRVRPKFVQAQTGYMQGAAGVGSFLLHLAATINATSVKIAFPDMPLLPSGWSAVTAS